MTCVGIMMIATESVRETEIENENQAEDRPSANGNRNENVSENENENEIDVTREETPHIVQDTKNIKKGRKHRRDSTRCVRSRIVIVVFLVFGVNHCIA